MPTIGQIKEVIAANLHKSTSDYVKGTGANQIDLLLLALNNARKSAEKLHDFAICRKRGYFSHSGGLQGWRNPTWFSGSGTARKVKTWYERVEGDETDGAFGGVDRVLRAITQDQKAQLYAREDYLEAPLWPNERYVADSESAVGRDPLLSQTYVVLEGHNFYIHPTSNATRLIVVDTFYWWADWTLGTDNDWWTENGVDFLIMQAIVEANLMTQHFVGNVAGNMAPPVKEANAALANLIQLDKDSTEGGVTLFDL
jgi:hypothetical protein